VFRYVFRKLIRKDETDETDKTTIYCRRSTSVRHLPCNFVQIKLKILLLCPIIGCVSDVFCSCVSTASHLFTFKLLFPCDCFFFFFATCYSNFSYLSFYCFFSVNYYLLEKTAPDAVRVCQITA